MDLRIFPPEEILEATVQLPPSKSIAARKLTMDFISGGCRPLKIELPADADCADIKVIANILSAGIPTDGTDVDAASSGTALRIITALAAAIPGAHCRINGSDSLRSRPVGPLVDALVALGADIRCTVREGFAPLEIKGKRLAGGAVHLDPSASSQFATALMLATPLMEKPLAITYTVPTISGPYVVLTAQMMSARGVTAQADSDGVVVGAGNYSPASNTLLEPDWSAAAFWYEIAAITAGWVTLPGLTGTSFQADKAAADVFGKLGVVTDFGDEGAELSASPELFSFLELDMSETPDLVPAVAVTACMVGVPFRLSGVAGLRHKESDRLSALCDELLKVGCVLSIGAYDNTLEWDGCRLPVRELPVFDAHSDHRIAMALAPVSVFVPGIVIKDADCVGKSYPAFWSDLESAGFTTSDPSAPLPRREEAE